MRTAPQPIRLLSFSILFLAAPGLHAQQPAPTVSFRVYTEPAGARFAVDGVIYTSSANFQWPVGSKHLVRYVQEVLPPSPVSTPGSPSPDPIQPGQLGGNGSVIYSFGGWSDNTGLLAAGSDPNQTVTADPALTYLKASVTLSYRLILNFFSSPAPGAAPTCGAPGPAPVGSFQVGLVFIGSQCYWNNAVLYVAAGSTLNLNAFPYPGFVFMGWSGLGSSNASSQSFTLQGPLTLAPRFGPAKRVRFETNPLGLQVMVDRTPAPTLSSEDPNAPCPHNEGLPVTVLSTFQALCRGDFDFAPGSTHLIGAPSPQIDLTGTSWVFDSWGNGQGQNAVYTADNQTSASDKVLVKFVRGAQASFVTSPPGLKLTIDGRSNWPAYNFVWAAGSTHQVAAPAQQVDSAGRQYTFKSWSNGGGLSQTVTMDQNAVSSGFRIIATFDVLSRVVVQTSPPGIKLQVDGADCQSPCTADRAAGTQLRLTAPASIALSGDSRLDLAGWSDGGAADHVFTIASDTQTVSANYIASNRLNTSSDPQNGGLFLVDPISPDMFYPADTTVEVSLDSKPGFKFRRWAGDLTGTYPSGVVTMSAPRSAIALMDRVPYIAPAGVKNAAGDTPDGAVGPGSLVAIAGESLAPDTIQGRINPLAQTIGGVTVTIGDRLLPLVSVSPQRIVAQIPSDLPDGNYTLQVHAPGQPDVSGDFTVTRDAPGLFSNFAGSKMYSMANHPDGTPVTPDNPAASGETITLLGTGFGPYTAPVIDGFLPSDPPPALADPVDVLIGDQVYQPVWSGAAAGYTGMVAIKLKITDGMMAAAGAPLSVRVNGKMSNTVPAPFTPPTAAADPKPEQ